MNKMVSLINEVITEVFEKKLEIPEIPNTMNFWHGGDLDRYDDNITQKKGRYEYGVGLYLTTHYGTAKKYAKGSRRLYLITVANGNDLNYSFITYENALSFIKSYVIGNKKKDVLFYLNKHNIDGNIKAYIFNNILINEDALSSSNTKYLRKFWVENGIDYQIVDNPFGWGEKMLVLYNMNKIVNTIIVRPNDSIEKYDL